MNNADMPAMAQEYALWCESIGECPTLGTGLTKREYFAAIAMQGIISADIDAQRYPEDIARYAVTQADALLKELEK